MRKLILCIVCIFSALCASAQTKVTWSMELGLGMSTWMGNGSDGSNPMFNPKVGVGIDVPLSGLVSFQTGLTWASKGASYKMEGYKTKVNQNYLEMPLLAAFHVGTASNFDMVFTAGPYLAYGVNGKTDWEIDDLTMSWDSFGDSKIEGKEIDGLNRFDAGIQAGVGLDFKRWTVGLDGEFGLCRISGSDTPRNLAFFFTVGYKF